MTLCPSYDRYDRRLNAVKFFVKAITGLAKTRSMTAVCMSGQNRSIYRPDNPMLHNACIQK